MRLGYIKDENGKLVRKWIKEGEEGKDPNVLYQVHSQFGDYIWTDEEHMDEAKGAFLEQMINTIRQLAKIDQFWIVKREDDFRHDAQDHPAREIQGLSVEEFVPQEAKDGKCTLGWKIGFPQLDGYYQWDEAEKLRNQLDEISAEHI